MLSRSHSTAAVQDKAAPVRRCDHCRRRRRYSYYRVCVVCLGDPAARAVRVCRHCRTRIKSRPRGLCHVCFSDEAVRVLYPPKPGVYLRGRVGLQPPHAWPDPTAAKPGSPDKVAVLEARAAAGQSLWHPADAALDPESARRPARHLPLKGVA